MSEMKKKGLFKFGTQLFGVIILLSLLFSQQNTVLAQEEDPPAPSPREIPRNPFPAEAISKFFA